MKKNGFTLRELFAVLMIFAALLAVLVPALAVDRGPQKQITLVSTNSNPATVALPIGDTGRFDPTWLLVTGTWLSGTNALTQTVSYVSGAYTGSVVTVTANTAKVLTNSVPTLFYGDKFLITTTGLQAVTNTVTVIGEVHD